MKYIIKNESDLTDKYAIETAERMLRYLPEKEGVNNCRIVAFGLHYVAIIVKNKTSYTIMIRNESEEST